MCPARKDWISTTALRLRKFWYSLLAIAAVCAGPIRAAQPWTVDAILNIPTLADPQIRPDGRRLAYVRRSLDGKAWRNVIYVAPVPSGPSQEIGRGSIPRWSPDSRHLAYLHGQVYVDGKAVTHSPSAPLAYSWTPDSAGIAYLATDPGLLMNGEVAVNPDELKKMKARIEVICDRAELQALIAFLKTLLCPPVVMLN